MIYAIINKIFAKHRVDLTAAEAHGVASGMLCADDRSAGAAWLAALLADAESLTEQDRNLLLRLFDETRKLLTGEGFEFDLLLPDEDGSLTVQIEALKNWCQGFLFGVGMTNKISEAEWPDDMREIVRDISEFTKLEDQAGGEEDEKAFVEITEYLRSAVVLLHDDLVDLKLKDESL